MEHTIAIGSLWQIVTNTSTFGMLILLVLFFMSVVSWVIIFHKLRQFKTVEADNLNFRHHFDQAATLAESVGQAKTNNTSPLSKIYLSGYKEYQAITNAISESPLGGNTLTKMGDSEFEILEMAMEKTLTEEIGFLEKKVIFLATTANSAPFIGLLGTVVGIMDAFWAIGERGSASLAVVAPGIAEALLATIVGLAAAIPAVIAYNWASNKIKYLNDRSFSFILGFITKVKKENLL